MIASRFALRAALPGLLLACTLPATASATEAAPATSGGLTSAASSTEPASAVAPAAAAPAAPTEATLPGAGVWSVPSTGTTSRPVRVTGRFEATLVGRAVRLQRKTPGNRWMTVATSRVRKAGEFGGPIAKNHGEEGMAALYAELGLGENDGLFFAAGKEKDAAKLAGAFGDGVGKWRFEVTGEFPGMRVSSLNRNYTDGTVTNLTDADGHGEQAAEAIFD